MTPHDPMLAREFMHFVGNGSDAARVFAERLRWLLAEGQDYDRVQVRARCLERALASYSPLEDGFNEFARAEAILRVVDTGDDRGPGFV